MERMINTKCHGCHTPMQFEAVPVTIVEWTGEAKTYWGKDDAVWICKVCREDPRKLREARKATGWLPEKPEVSSYDGHVGLVAGGANFSFTHKTIGRLTARAYWGNHDA